MEAKYSGVDPGWRPANERHDDAAYYAKRAAIEREHARSAANEVVAVVHRNLACKYAALAVERARTAPPEARVAKGDDAN